MDFDSSDSIWKLDGPIGRFDFFKIFFIALVSYFIQIFAMQNQLARLFIIIFLIVGLVILYLSIVATIKRLWDIFASRGTAIICFFVFGVLAAFIPFGQWIYFGMLLFIPGQCTLGE